MKQSILLVAALFLSLSMMTTSCSKEDTITIDSSMPNGTFTVSRTGTLTAQSNTPTEGTVELGTDEDGVNFLRLGSNFKTELATGTVTVYFSTSSVFKADPASGNPDLILSGAITKNGEQFFKLNKAISSNFTHVILWCNTAGVPFGNAPLQ